MTQDNQDQDGLQRFTSQQLLDEVKRRKELAKQEQLRLRDEAACFWESKIDSILELVPKHSRTSCDDSKAINENRCTRCYLLCAKTAGWDSDRELVIYVNTRREL